MYNLARYTFAFVCYTSALDLGIRFVLFYYPDSSDSEKSRF